jgi:hypothetical protein
MSFIEESARIFQLSKSDSLKLLLACEEVFLYLCSTGRQNEQMEVEITSGGYYIQVKFPLKSKNINLNKFNLTASISTEETGSLEDMGLLIASRSVERFYITGNDADLHLVLIKEKTYPLNEDMELPEEKLTGSYSIRTPDAGN